MRSPSAHLPFALCAPARVGGVHSAGTGTGYGVQAARGFAACTPPGVVQSANAADPALGVRNER